MRLKVLIRLSPGALTLFQTLFQTLQLFNFIILMFVIAASIQSYVVIVFKALRQTVFAKNFVFASFGNCRFSKIRVGASFLSFFRTRLDSQKLVPTCSDPNFREKWLFFRENQGFCRNFCFREFRKLPFFKNQGRSKFFELFPNSSRLAKTRSDSKLNSNFGKKFGMQGPSCIARGYLSIRVILYFFYFDSIQ